MRPAGLRAPTRRRSRLPHPAAGDQPVPAEGSVPLGDHRLGLALDVEPDPHVLFGEGPGRYLLEIDPEQEAAFVAAVPDARRIGVVLADPVVVFGDIELTLDQIGAAWKSGPDQIEGAA